MPVEQVVPGICAYLGGSYDVQFRRYAGATPTPLIGAVRAARPKQTDSAEYFLAQQAGARTGAVVTVRCARHHRHRVTGGPAAGQQNPPQAGHLERIVYDLQLDVRVRSSAAYAEDTQDDVWAIETALIARLRYDPTLGGVVFQAGEGVDDGLGGPGVEVEYGDLESSAGLTKTFFRITLAATEYLYG